MEKVIGEIRKACNKCAETERKKQDSFCILEVDEHKYSGTDIRFKVGFNSDYNRLDILHNLLGKNQLFHIETMQYKEVDGKLKVKLFLRSYEKHD